MNTCKVGLKDKVREGLVGMLSLKSGGTLVLKLMLDTILDVGGASIHSLAQNQ